MRSIGEWEDATVPWKQMVVAIGLVVLTGMMGSVGSLPTRAQQATPVAAVSPTIAPIQSPRPRVFIASSVEGLPIAEAIALDMQFVADVTIWDQGVFPLSEGTLPALDAAANQSDFAVVVLTADDMTTKRGQTYPVPRDNVLFELGFFMGRLGVERTYMVISRDTPPTLPSHLRGTRGRESRCGDRTGVDADQAGNASRDGCRNGCG